MTNTHVSALNQTVQETHAWLRDLATGPGLGNEEQAYTALRAVLHSLRDRLTVNEAVHLSAQLPMLVRGFYFEGWRPVLAPNMERSAEDFFASVEESLRNAAFDLDTETITRTVFTFLEARLAPGQIRHVKSQLPQEIQALWLSGPLPPSGQEEDAGAAPRRSGERRPSIAVTESMSAVPGGTGGVGVAGGTSEMDEDEAELPAGGKRR